MKVKIKQFDLLCLPKVKQLPSKQIYLFQIKKQNKFLTIPVDILMLVQSEPISEAFVFYTNLYKNGFDNTLRTLNLQKFRLELETQEIPLPPQ